MDMSQSAHDTMIMRNTRSLQLHVSAWKHIQSVLLYVIACLSIPHRWISHDITSYDHESFWPNPL